MRQRLVKQRDRVYRPSFAATAGGWLARKTVDTAGKKALKLAVFGVGAYAGLKVAGLVLSPVFWILGAIWPWALLGVLAWGTWKFIIKNRP